MTLQLLHSEIPYLQCEENLISILNSVYMFQFFGYLFLCKIVFIRIWLAAEVPFSFLLPARYRQKYIQRIIQTIVLTQLPAEMVCLNLSGAQESIPRNRFRQPL